MRKKILFIIPYIPYPLDSGGNQAFFNMVEYLRHKMSVSVLLYPETEKRMQDVESLKKIWDNVDFLANGSRRTSFFFGAPTARPS